MKSKTVGDVIKLMQQFDLDGPLSEEQWNDIIAQGDPKVDPFETDELIEYRIRKVERYIVTRFHRTGRSQGSSQIGEYENADTAYQVGYALAKREHQIQGWPIGDMRIRYPEDPKAADAVPVTEDEPLTLKAVSALYDTSDKVYFHLSSPDTLAEAYAKCISPAKCCVLTDEDFRHMAVSGDFANLFDPVSKFELLRDGRVGTILGVPVLTFMYAPEKRRGPTTNSYFLF